MSNHYNNFSSIPYSCELNKEIINHGALVFGAMGEMGSKITSTFPRASIKTIMQDIHPEKLKQSREEAIKTSEKALSKRKLSHRQWAIINKGNLFGETIVFPNNGAIPFDQINQSKELVEKYLDEALGKDNQIRKDYSNLMMVLEACPEILSFKQNIFRFFELALTSTSTILATNTSSLSVDEIAAKLEHPERAVGFHYFLPAHINPLIEIIAGSKTSLEVIQAMHNLAIAMGKKPIICWKDKPGAIANRILVGILNEAARIYDEGIANIDLIDEVFLETFYPIQIKVQTKSAKRQFEAAPKLVFFKDETTLYEKIKDCNNETKRKYIEELQGKLRQKVLYAQIVENLATLGSFFTPASSVLKIKELAQKQLKSINEYLFNVEKNPQNISKPLLIIPYDFPNQNKNLKTDNSREIIKKRLQGAYIAISQQILNEGLATSQDIELACKEGFKYNIGPFELTGQLGEARVIELTTLVNENIDQTKTSGISKPGEYIKVGKYDLSGVQYYIQNNVGFIYLGRLHIQNLVMVQNSLGPDMLEGILNALCELKSKNVKAVLFRSQGGGAFSSGADLNYIASTNWDTKKILEFRNLGKKVMNEIANYPIPTIAIVDGPGVGGGLELALACDYRIMTDLSFVAMPEVALGIIPDWGGTERLPAIVGKNLAKRLICTAQLKNLGLKLSSEDAQKVGLADLFVSQAELPILISNLIYRKSPIDIYTKPQKKSNFNKDIKDYPAHIVKRFKLNKSFKHNFRWITRHTAYFAEDLINHSEDENYAKRVNNDDAFTKLIKSGNCVSNTQIKPFLQAAQSKFWAPIFENIGLLK